MATEIAGRGTGPGIMGMAPEAIILPVKVEFQTGDTAQALETLAATDDPPEIVNMSYQNSPQVVEVFALRGDSADATDGMSSPGDGVPSRGVVLLAVIAAGVVLLIMLAVGIGVMSSRRRRHPSGPAGWPR